MCVCEREREREIPLIVENKNKNAIVKNKSLIEILKLVGYNRDKDIIFLSKNIEGNKKIKLIH